MTRPPRLLPLPYCQDKHLLAALSPLPWLALLSSGAAAGQSARWSLACADPLARFEIHAGDPLGVEKLKTCLESQSKRTGTEVPPAAQTAEWPFISGWLGYLSYDAGRLFESLPTQAAADLEVPWVRLGYYAWSLVSDHHAQSTWLVGDFSDGLYRQLQRRLQKQGQPLADDLKLTTPFQSNLSKAAYLERFEQVAAYLKAGDAYQVNLAQRFSARYQGSLKTAWLRLQADIDAPFAACLDYGDTQILSLSPERFLRLDAQRQLTTQPIKGTRPRGLDPAQDAALQADLLCHPKDRAENLMIVDLLRNDLGRVCRPGSIRVPDLFTLETHSYVHHLVSRVCGELAADKSFFDAIQASFPGGSITGAPKLRAMQIIEALEPCRRSVYCGAIGYLDDRGLADFNIAIRTLIAQDGQLHLWGGGGLVADSLAETEYEETLHKVARLLRVLEPGFGFHLLK